MKQSYWNNNGKHQGWVDALQQLIPDCGCIRGKKNAKLERLRKAINCYHDLYNNGLYNRMNEFRQLFFASSRYKSCRHNAHFAPELYARVEEIMDKYIEEAFEEQKVNIVLSL